MRCTPPTIDVAKVGDVHVIKFTKSAELDLSRIRELRTEVKRLLDETEDRPARIVLDLDGMEPTSPVIGMIIAVTNVMSRCGGQFHVVVDTEYALRVFDVMKLGQILKVFSNTQTAMRAFA